MGWTRFFRRAKWDRERQQELESYIQIETDENLARGMPFEQARAAATRKLGNRTRINEEIYRMNTVNLIDTIGRDLCYGLRALRRSPSFTIVAVLTLALGIGANTAMFAVIDAILIQPLPYPQAEALVSVWHTAPGLPGTPDSIGSSASMYFTYREENRTFEHLGLWRSGGASVTGVAEPELPRALFVTFGVLDAVGVKPLLGRWFSRADDTPGSAETIMLTYGYWQRRFAGDTAIVGRTLTIDSRPHTVIGVMPENFRFQGNPELILPQRFERNRQFLGPFGFLTIARLKPGVSMEQANADVGRMLGAWLNAWPPNPGIDRTMFEDARLTPKIQPLKQEVVGDIGTALWVVMATLGLVLLIACANVANLLLVRAEARRSELAIRAALGANWGRIARALLVESMTLGVLGGALGLGLAFAALRILVAKGPATLPLLYEIGIDPFVLAFSLGVSLLSGALFGVIPVLKYARPRVGAALPGVRTASQGREHHRARNTLVVVQVALALVLLIGSGLMIRTFQQLRNVQPGFMHPEEIQILHSMIPAAIAKEPERVMRMQHEILDKLAAIPGVTSVGFADRAPLESFLGNAGNPVYAEDKTLAEGQVPPIRQIRRIAPGFFKTMGTRVIAGRDLTWTDLYEKRRVAIVSENLAREWWGVPGAALGKRIREGGAADPWREIVGVVENVYDNGMHVKPPEFAYWPALMDRYIWGGQNGFAVGSGMFAIRSNRTGTESLLAEAQQAIWSVNGRQPVFLVTVLKTLYDQSMARTSFTLVMLAIAGAMALMLGLIGIYGVIAYAVSQRRREIGIRLALGARQRELKLMFVREGLLLSGIGVVIGLLAAIGLTRLMTSLLFEVSPLDPFAYAAAPIVLVAAAMLASYLPARRAAGVNPVETLKGE